jgi:putative component of membrane protein insertase Oxa1/YidC/SpoIIIJ protein YidD
MTTTIVSPLAVGAIRLYERHISPIKGFRCAYGAEQGLKTCSAFGRHVFERYEASVALSLLRRRFAACRQAYARLKLNMAAPHASTPSHANTKNSARASNQNTCRDSAKKECLDRCACDGAEAAAHGAGNVIRGASGACDASICDAGACLSL